MVEGQKIARHQRHMWHRAEYQCDHQDPKDIAIARPRKCIATKCAKRQRNGDYRNNHDQGIQPCPPEFILDPNCPLPLVREFLAGIFGGDGHTCNIAKNTFTYISFSQSKHVSCLDSLKLMMEQIINILREELFGALQWELQMEILRIAHQQDMVV